MLVDKQIIALSKINAMIYPFNFDNLSAASYDLTYKGDPITIPAHSYALVPTYEKIELPPAFGAKTVSKSSIARQGISIGDVGGWVDPGFRGNLTLAAFNQTDEDYIIYDGMKICQIVFFMGSYPAVKPYDGHYQDSEGLVESVLS